ncbi:hypothetical protein I307_05901 [Cryptococcus deuterogattii 99/473]|uniref:Phenol 2-monooxygenase n=1 Tax=Cryptococcus deuterogattii Ram5 TaxID=1296110 RepID=A0A0D0TWI8_9TREE|nr:hypothetical protein I313_03533 [Cryptococcus deuterogattii Ram5]KIY54717.1 hypothetical protein I307_05901 [Cryptococcus deuterogattii 99/473]
MSKKLDVAIVGSGSAGLAAALWLSTYNVRVKIFERMDGPLKLGHADGVQCRTVEIFESFKLASALLAESKHIVEVVFWSQEKSGLKRQGQTPDPPPGLSHQPHVVLKQGRVNEMLVDEMKKRNGQAVDYSSNVVGVSIDKDADNDPEAYPVTCVVDKEGVKETYQTKYLLGCDGAHSTTRHALNLQMNGDSTEAIWGVMDVTVKTDFPDINKKCTVRTPRGSILLIPREQEDLVRFYVEMPHGTNRFETRLEDIHAKARDILQGFKIDFVSCLSWSAYAIGQRLASSLHQDYRIFLTGDACHTHSPKAGQGMNVSLQDGFNIGWKLGAVLCGQSPPSLLKTYVQERQKTAKELIEFDKQFSRMMASDVDEAASAEEFEAGFRKSGKFTTGLSAEYEKSELTEEPSKSLSGNDKIKIVPGMRFPSAQVVRFADSVPQQLLKVMLADGKWRIVIFGGSRENLDKVNEIGEFLATDDGPLATYKGKHDSIGDALIDPILVLSGDRTKYEFKDIHRAFWPDKGENKLIDYHKIQFDDESYHQDHGHAYDTYGIDPRAGAICIVRPDQYVSALYTLNEYKNIAKFFDQVLIKPDWLK